jgi:hypothetical protein
MLTPFDRKNSTSHHRDARSQFWWIGHACSSIFCGGGQWVLDFAVVGTRNQNSNRAYAVRHCSNFRIFASHEASGLKASPDRDNVEEVQQSYSSHRRDQLLVTAVSWWLLVRIRSNEGTANACKHQKSRPDKRSCCCWWPQAHTA